MPSRVRPASATDWTWSVSRTTGGSSAGRHWIKESDIMAGTARAARRRPLARDWLVPWERFARPGRT